MTGRDPHGSSSVASRWKGKTQQWKDGWRNRHAQRPAVVTATFVVEGRSEPIALTRTWSEADALDGGTRPDVTALLARAGAAVEAELVRDAGKLAAQLGELK